MSRGRVVRDEEGFTLIEMVMVIVIMPIIVGGIAIALVTSLGAQSGVSTRLGDSHDAQITSANFVRDIQGAQFLSTNTTPFCGGGSQVLGLSWLSSDGTKQEVVSYSTRSLGTGGSTEVFQNARIQRFSLVRSFCSSGNNPIASNTVTVAHDLQDPAVAPLVVNLVCNTKTDPANDCAKTAQTATVGSFSTLNVASAQIEVTELSGFHFTLKGSPRAWGPASGGFPPGGSSNVPPLLLIGSGTSASFQGDRSCNMTVNGTAAINGQANDISTSQNPTFTASQVYSQGGTVSGNYSGPYLQGPPLADPFANLQPPVSGSPGVTDVWTTWTNPPSTISGIYILHAGMALSNYSVTSVTPGSLIYVANGPTSLSGNANTNVTLKPYTPGGTNPYQNIVIWISKDNPTPTLSLGGNGQNTSLGGIVYGPTAIVTLSGGGNSGTFNSLGLVVHNVACNGGGGGSGFTLGPMATTTTLMSAPSNPSLNGQTVTFKATVTPSGATGNIAFDVTDSRSSAPIPCVGTGTAPVAMSAGSASCTISALSRASSPYTVVAGYQGDATHAASVGTMQQVVVFPTTTALTSSANPAVVGQLVTYTATVSPQATGAVTFTDGGVPIGGCSNVPLTGASQATCAQTYAVVGAHAIQATYGSGPGFAGSSSSTVTEVVNPASTVTSVSSSVNPQMKNQPVTFTATVVVGPPGAGLPTGSVTFTANGTPIIGCASLALGSNGQAACATSFPLAGTYAIVAGYTPAGNSFAPSTSSAFSETVSSGPILSNFAEAPGTNNEVFSGSTTVNSGTVTINIYAGPTATGVPVLTLTLSTYSGSGPYSWTVADKRKQLAGGTQYTAQAVQVDGAGNQSANSPTVTFTTA